MLATASRSGAEDLICEHVCKLTFFSFGTRSRALLGILKPTTLMPKPWQNTLLHDLCVAMERVHVTPLRIFRIIPFLRGWRSEGREQSLLGA